MLCAGGMHDLTTAYMRTTEVGFPRHHVSKGTELGGKYRNRADEAVLSIHRCQTAPPDAPNYAYVHASSAPMVHGTVHMTAAQVRAEKAAEIVFRQYEAKFNAPRAKAIDNSKKGPGGPESLQASS